MHRKGSARMCTKLWRVAANLDREKRVRVSHLTHHSFLPASKGKDLILNSVQGF